MLDNSLAGVQTSLMAPTDTIKVGNSTFTVAHVLHRVAQYRSLADHYDRIGEHTLARQGRTLADGLAARVAA